MDSPVRVDRRKVLLSCLIAATAAAPPVFVRYDEPQAWLAAAKGLAKAGSLSGIVILLWQFLLGFRGILSRMMPDHPWQVEVHKRLGQYGSLLILLHPVFITVYYLAFYDINIFLFGRAPSRDPYVILGIAALAVIVWLVASSAYLRPRFTFGTWFATHLSSYLLLPVLLVHSFAIGQTVRGTGLRFVWLALTGVVALLYLYRLAHALGAFARRYTVARVQEVAEDVSEISLRPPYGGFRPGIGDFVYVRRRVWGRAHPYTVSRFDREAGTLSITVKALGLTSSELQEIRPGARMLVDGSYGVFANELFFSSDPVVIVAGGIGITPFLRLAHHLEDRPRPESWLFYGNKRLEDIAYRGFLEGLKNTRVVHVLEDEPDFPGEQGIIDAGLLSRRLPRPLEAYRFFICGPPPMLRNLRRQLSEAGVPAGQVHYELFAE